MAALLARIGLILVLLIIPGAVWPLFTVVIIAMAFAALFPSFPESVVLDEKGSADLQILSVRSIEREE